MQKGNLYTRDGDNTMGCHVMQSELFDADAILFILICELQSFSKAAKVLGYSQAAVKPPLPSVRRSLRFLVESMLWKEGSA